MKVKTWFALLALLAFFGLANPGAANGGTLVALTLVPVLVYYLPAFSRPGGER